MTELLTTGMRRGLLIAFEGIDGTGKSTQVRLLARELTDAGRDVVVTCEPTDGQYGRKIRQLYGNRNSVTQEEELELFIADRREHVEKVIAPALASGKIVLTDRYYFSTAAYQGAAGLDPAMILARNEAFAPEPDIVLLLKVPVAVGIHRIKTLRKEALNDFEREESLAKVAAVFEKLDRDYIIKINAAQPAEAVHNDVMLHVRQLLRKRSNDRL